MEHKTYIEEKCEEFEKKAEILRTEGGLLGTGGRLMPENVNSFLSTSLHDLLNKINDWAEREKKEVPDEKVPFELGIDVINMKTIIKADTQGYNQALSDLQTHLASLGK